MTFSLTNWIKITAHYYRTPEDPKLEISLDWLIADDFWHQRYVVGTPRWAPDRMDELLLRNQNRCRRLKIHFTVCGCRLYLALKLKKIGLLLHGRILDEDAEAASWREARDRKRDT